MEKTTKIYIGLGALAVTGIALYLTKDKWMPMLKGEGKKEVAAKGKPEAATEKPVRSTKPQISVKKATANFSNVIADDKLYYVPEW